MFRVIFALALTLFSTSAMASLSCRYAEFTGLESSTFVRQPASEQDWYSPYKVVQFCIAAGGTGTYILILEELQHGFKVTNPPRKVLSLKTDAYGQMHYEIADDIDHVVLDLSADKRTLKVTAQRFGREVVETLVRETRDR